MKRKFTTATKKSTMEILAFMKKLSDFEKRSAEKNFLVGHKK